ncbi:unnamed protein product [Linum trigynum]|uniref:Uncharacterized protein n=1 Tax=Linum trigynum TaxID=586398 RepID=A0AAV2GKR9_9ROSI
MQDPRLPLSGEISNGKPRKKKGSSNSRASTIQLKGSDVREIQHGQAAAVPLPLRTSQKLSTKNLARNEYTPPTTMFQQTERSNSDSLPESSGSGNDYRALRRKYLLLEEESFALGTELTEIEDEVNTLEYEKLALLDQLIVLEGLVDPSEVQVP